jgi:hypothetical protein
MKQIAAIRFRDEADQPLPGNAAVARGETLFFVHNHRCYRTDIEELMIALSR